MSSAKPGTHINIKQLGIIISKWTRPFTVDWPYFTQIRFNGYLLDWGAVRANARIFRRTSDCLHICIFTRYKRHVHDEPLDKSLPVFNTFGITLSVYYMADWRWIKTQISAGLEVFLKNATSHILKINCDIYVKMKHTTQNQTYRDLRISFTRKAILFLLKVRLNS